MEPQRPKVFVVSNKDYNLDPAKIYGDVTILYDEQPRDVFMTSRHAFILKQRLAQSGSSDFLAIAGNMILLCLAFGILMERHGFVNLLLFDLRTMTYVPRVVAKHQITKEV